MRWFRLYSEVLHDPKVQRLTPAMFKHWVNLLCLASESEPCGLLPCIDHPPREKIDAVLAYTVADRFWQRVVLSPSKLREKFDTIDLQRQEDADGTRNRAAGRAGPAGGAHRRDRAASRNLLHYHPDWRPKPGTEAYYAQFEEPASVAN